MMLSLFAVLPGDVPVVAVMTCCVRVPVQRLLMNIYYTDFHFVYVSSPEGPLRYR